MSYGFLYPEGVLDMAIKINTEKRIFTLETKHTMYQMQADTYGVPEASLVRCKDWL